MAPVQEMAPSGFILLYLGKVAGGNIVGPQLIGTIDKPAEFQVLIAHHTRIGRAAGLVFISKVLNDVLLKILSLIDEVITDAEIVADRAGVAKRLRAATFILSTGNAILRPKL